MDICREELAKMIDHTQLHPYETNESIVQLVDEAINYGFGAVCVNPYWVATAKKNICPNNIKIVCVVGFPLGQNKTEIKVHEATDAINDGADELDMVINIAALKSQRFGYIEGEIKKIVALGVPVKVIIEACYLLQEEKIIACQLSKRAGAKFVKTSTGFGSSGATAEDVALMRRIVGNDMGVKAAGGISNWKQAKKMIDAGAARIGSSKSVQILNEYDNSSNK